MLEVDKWGHAFQSDRNSVIGVRSSLLRSSSLLCWSLKSISWSIELNTTKQFIPTEDKVNAFRNILKC